MSDPIRLSPRLHTRASESRYRHCPPERVCAWACVQGIGIPDVVIGAALALADVPGSGDPGIEPTRQALWDRYNTVQPA